MSKVGVATKEELDKHKKELDEVFYGETHLMGSRPKFWTAMRDKDIPYRVVNSYYENQEIVQIFKPVKKPSANLKIRTDKPFNIIYMDTMVIDEFYLINTIDLFTKFASSTPFKKPVTSSDSVKALKEFMESANIGLEDITEIRTDGGSEFLGVFKDFVESKREVSLPYAKTEMSPIERFNGTLRRILEKQKSYFGKPISYIYNYLPKAINGYNKSMHSSTGFSPIEAISSEEAQEASLKRSLTKKIKNPDPEVKKDATVRISVRDAMNPFDKKIGANWSTKLYKVTNVRGTRVFLDDGKTYKIHEVRALDPELLLNRIKPFSKKDLTPKPPLSNTPDVYDIYKSTRSKN